MANFYRAFEDKYRGSQASIKLRLRTYSPLIEKIKEEYEGVNSLDLGCGRGEWMSLLTELGVETLGIDLDDSMLSECRIRDLTVENADIISFLQACGTDSYHIITAFHIVEHLAFDDLCTVIDNAIRVLKPGGVLILETPNPENLIVGTNNFYLDPTHNKPIPALLLSFICGYYGLENNYIMRLQHPEGLLEKKNYGLYDVITGVSFDYAVIAQKKDPSSVELDINKILGDKSGYNLEVLSCLYDKRIESKFEELNNKLQSISSEIRLINERRKHEVSMLEKRMELIYSSRSWKYTAPLRVMSAAIKNIRSNNSNKSKNKNSLLKLKFINFKENKVIVNAYLLLNKLSPKSASFLKNKLNELVFDRQLKKILKAQTVKSKSVNNDESDESINNLNKLNHFELVAAANHQNMISTDHYLNYIKDVINSDGFQHLELSLPLGTDAWILKIQEALYRKISLNDIFPENIEDEAAATALYMVLLKRIPENKIITSKPVKHLCMLIQQSEEYRKVSGDNLKKWCDL